MISRRALLAGASCMVASPALAFPVITAPRPRRLDQMARHIGAGGNLAFALDAADSRSYLSGQTWYDITSNDRDFYRGADGSASTDDPTLVGPPGQLSRSTYFSFDGGDKFTALSNGTFINSLHKDNGKSTLVLAARFPSFASNAILFGTARLTTDVGIRHIIGTSGQLSIAVNNGGGSFQALIASSIVATANTPTVIVISVDEAGGAGASHVRINNQTETFNGAITSPSASNASRTMTIGANDINTQGFINGTRLWAVMGFSTALTTTQSAALYQSLIARIT